MSGMTRGLFMSVLLLASVSSTLSMHPHFRSWLPTFDYQFMVARPSVVYSKQHRPVDRPTMNRNHGAADVTAAASRLQQAAPGDVTSSDGARKHLLRVHTLLKIILSALKQYGLEKPSQSTAAPRQ